MSGIINSAGSRSGVIGTTEIDYEEGTWEAKFTIGGSATGIVHNREYGYYTKIGRAVHVNGYLSLTSKGSETGSVLITGLPFTSSSATANSSVASLGLAQTAFAASTDIGGIHTAGGTTIALSDTATGAGTTPMDETNLADNTAIQFQMTYMT